jgi:hypothetical protein
MERQAWTNQTLYMETAPVSTWSCDKHSPSHDPQNCKLVSVLDPAPYVAAFLITRGPSAVLQLAVQPARTLNYQTTFASLRIEPGVPLEGAREINPGVFQRKWSNGTITFDCEHFNGTFLPREL